MQRVAKGGLSGRTAFINTRNQVVDQIWRILLALTEPVLRPIRRFMPRLQGIDLSPIVLFIAIFAIQRIIVLYIYPYVF